MLPTSSNEVAILLRNQNEVWSSFFLHSLDDLGLALVSRKPPELIVEASPRQQLIQHHAERKHIRVSVRALVVNFGGLRE